MRNVILLIVLTLLAFQPCLTAGFVYWDDDFHVFENPAVAAHSPGTLSTIFTTAVNRTYIPLTVLSFNIEHSLFGFDPAVYHLDNLILHLSIVIGIYGLALRLGLSALAAFLGALIFAVHPMHVESVAWVTQRKDVLYSLFYILALLHYWNFLAQAKRRSYYLSLVCGFVSILAKPMALSLLLILLLLDWYRNGRIGRRAVLNILPFVLAIAPVAGITYQMNARVPQINLPDGALIWLWSAAFYIKKFFAPFVCLPLYQLPKPVSLVHPAYLSSVLVLAAAAFALYRQRGNRLFVFAALFYVCSTFFLWRYDNTVDVTIVGDRFMYLPSLGLCLWLGRYLADRVKDRRPEWVITVSVFFYCLMALTQQQSQIWRNDLTLWQHELIYEHSSARAYNSYGVALLKDRQPQAAISALNRSIALNPIYALAYYNRGLALSRTNQHDNALADFSRSLQLNPRHANSYLERATLFGRQGHYAQALEDIEEALRLEPGNAGIYNNRGVFYKKLGQYDQALTNFDRAVELNPKLRAAYVNRAAVWKLLNDEAAALEDLKRAEQLRENYRKHNGK